MQPSLKSTATRTASLDRRRPIAVNGDAFNQSPACGAATALSLIIIIIIIIIINYYYYYYYYYTSIFRLA